MLKNGGKGKMVRFVLYKIKGFYYYYFYLTIGLFDLGKVISRTGFKSHVLHSLRRRQRE